MFGFNVDSQKDAMFAICHTDYSSKTFGNKFGKVEQGMASIDKISSLFLSEKKHADSIMIEQCGFII